MPYTTAGAEPKCASPRRIAGRTFGALSSDEFACPPEIVSAPRYVEAEAGKDSVSAKFTGDISFGYCRNWVYFISSFCSFGYCRNWI